MTYDRNKSDRTHVATATASAWLSCLGCKPVESEVPVDEGWTADLASFWSPTMTEARRARLLNAICPDAASPKEAFTRMCRQVAGRLTILVEVKVSRADFLSDFGRKYGTYDRPASADPPAHLCVIAAPLSVFIPKDKPLSNWAYLRLSEDCGRVIKFDAQWHANPVHPIQIENLIAEVAIRRDHHTRYSSWRRFMRAYRIEKTKERERRAEVRSRILAGTEIPIDRNSGR